MYMNRPLAFYVYIHDNRYIICAAKNMAFGNSTKQ